MITSSSNAHRPRFGLLLLAPLLLLLGCGQPAAPETAPVAAFEFLDLAHGGRLVVVPDPAAELVEGVVRFSGGSIQDPAGQTGLAEVLADALGYGGPMQYSGSQLHERLAAQDSWLRVSATPEYLSFDFACPPAALATTLDALADLLRFPHYPPESVDRARVRLLERLDAEAVDPAAIADQVLLDSAYGSDAPYTRAPTFESVEAIERDDLLAFHQAYIGANCMQVGVTGPVDATAMQAVLATALGELEPVEPAPTVVQPPFDVAEHLRLRFIEVPGALHTEIRMGRPGVSIHDRDYAPLRLWSDAHGAAEGSSLPLALSSIETGIVTQMGAFFRPRWGDPGEFLAYATTTETEPTAALERLSMWIGDSSLDGERRAALPGTAIAAARSRVLAADERAARGRELVGRLLDLEAHGLSTDYWEQHTAQLGEIGALRMRAAADRQANLDGWLVVFCAPMAMGAADTHQWRALIDAARERRHIRGNDPLFDQLSKTFDRLMGRRDAYLSASWRVETRSFAPRGTPEGLAALERMFESLGGRAAWAELARLDLQGEVRTYGATEPIGVRLWRDFEGQRLRLEHMIGGVESQRVVTPGDAWTRQADVQEDIAPEVLASVHFREARQLPRVLRDLATKRAMSVRLNEQRLEVLHWGRLLCWIELGQDGRPAVLGYAPTETERQGESEFKVWAEPVGGIVLPWVVEEPTLGRSYVWSSARVNEPFGDSLFLRE